MTTISPKKVYDVCYVRPFGSPTEIIAANVFGDRLFQNDSGELRFKYNDHYYNDCEVVWVRETELPSWETVTMHGRYSCD